MQNNITPCPPSASEPAFSRSLIGLKNEYILSFTIGLQSDNTFEEQKKLQWGVVGGGGTDGSFIHERTPKMGLVSQRTSPASRRKPRTVGRNPAEATCPHSQTVLPAPPSCSRWLLEKPRAGFNGTEFFPKSWPKRTSNSNCHSTPLLSRLHCKKTKPTVKGGDFNAPRLRPGKSHSIWKGADGLVYFGHDW